ncbi:MAG: efflux RND transporter permease subunit [Bacteriovoracaceae bacterium]
MKKLIEFFVERSLLVNLLTAIILFVGGLSLYNLQREMFPNVDFDVITITTVYPGTSAEDVEKLITLNIERELKGVDGIKEMNAMSLEGTSIIYLNIDPDVILEDVLEDVKNAVDVVDDLPEDAEIPRVVSMTNKNRSTIKIPLIGEDYNQLRLVSRKLRDHLESLNGVSRVNLEGYHKDEIRVEVNQDKLNLFQITVGEVYEAIRQNNISLSAGKIKDPKGDIIVRTTSEFQTTQDIKDVVIRSNSTGQNVRVGQLANVIKVPEEATILERSNGQRAIFLDVFIKKSSDIIRLTKEIKEATKDFFESPKNSTVGVNYRFTDDLSYYVKRRLDILSSSGLTGIVLVFLCLLVFLNLGTSVVTSLGAPIAFMIAFIAMDFLGISVNLISMFALIMVLGMLVDDSIIVAEHFFHHIEEKKPPLEAARLAAIATVKPVLATVITTMIAFSSLFFMGGIMGKFLWPIPAVAIICLLGSLLECFFILPSHLSDFAMASRHKKEREHRWYNKFVQWYGKVLNPCLKHPFLTSITFIVVLVGVLFVAKGMRFELFPGDDVRVVYLQMKGKVGTPLETTSQNMMKLEQMVLKELDKTELEQIRSKVGSWRGEHSRKTGGHYGSLVIYLTPPDERTRGTDELVEILTTKAKVLTPDFIISSNKMRGGPPRGKALEIEILGESFDELKQSSREILDIVKSVPGVSGVELDFELGKKQLIVDINSVEAKRLGLTNSKVALELRKVLGGDSITEIKGAEDDIEIKIYLPKDQRANIDSLDKFYLLNNSGQRILLSRIADFKDNQGALVIRRKDRKRIFSISGSLNKEEINPIEAERILAPKVDKVIKKYKTLDYRFGGENEDTQESMQELAKAATISFVCIFFVLVVMFNSLGQPFVIMSSIPMGAIGVVLAFKIKGIALSFMGLLGVVALVGVVVNDSIVLVNFINERRKSHEDDFFAVLEAAKGRFRAVILTTFTTVVGLLPIAHAGFFGGSAGDPFVKPMAFSFAYGLLFASVITLFFIPANYLIYLKILNFFKRLLMPLKEKFYHINEEHFQE